jgi:hypothetical protein
MKTNYLGFLNWWVEEGEGGGFLRNLVFPNVF